MARPPVVQRQILEIMNEGAFTLDFLVSRLTLDKSQVRAALKYGEKTGKFRQVKIPEVESTLWMTA